jgi:hypothetical protein
MIKSKTFVSFAIGASLFAGVISEARAENPLEFSLKLFAPKSQGAHRNQSDTTSPSDPVSSARDANLFS